MPIRYTTEDSRSTEQAAADDRTREDVERSGGIWAQMTAEQRARLLARLRDKKQRALAARARRQAEQDTLELRVARLEERLARLVVQRPFERTPVGILPAALPSDLRGSAPRPWRRSSSSRRPCCPTPWSG